MFRADPPRLIATRPSLRIGATGHFVAGAASIPFGFILLIVLIGGIGALSREFHVSVVLSAGLFMHSFTSFGFWRSYGWRIGAGAFVGGMVASSLMLASGLLASVSCDEPPYCYRGMPGDAPLLLEASFVALGVTSIMEGVMLLMVRTLARSPPAASVGAGLHIVAGTLLVSVLGAFLGGFFVLAVALWVSGAVVMGVSPSRKPP